MKEHEFNLEQLNRLKEEFMHQVAHELRTPLAVIKMQVEAIEDGMYENNDEAFLKLRDKFTAFEKIMDEMSKGRLVSK